MDPTSPPYYFAHVASPGINQRDGAAEAKMVLGFAKSRGWRWRGELPLIYDFETSNGQPSAKCAATWSSSSAPSTARRRGLEVV